MNFPFGLIYIFFNVCARRIGVYIGLRFNTQETPVYNIYIPGCINSAFSKPGIA